MPRANASASQPKWLSLKQSFTFYSHTLSLFLSLSMPHQRKVTFCSHPIPDPYPPVLPTTSPSELGNWQSKASYASASPPPPELAYRFTQSAASWCPCPLNGTNRPRLSHHQSLSQLLQCMCGHPPFFSMPSLQFGHRRMSAVSNSRAISGSVTHALPPCRGVRHRGQLHRPQCGHMNPPPPPRRLALAARRRAFSS